MIISGGAVCDAACMTVPAARCLSQSFAMASVCLGSWIFAVLFCGVADDPAPFFGRHSLLLPCNAHSSSPQQVLSPTQATALDRADRQARQETGASVSSTRRTNGSKREESLVGRVCCAVQTSRSDVPTASLKMGSGSVWNPN